MEGIQPLVIIFGDVIRYAVDGEGAILDPVCEPANHGSEVGVVGLGILQVAGASVISYNDVLISSGAIGHLDRLDTRSIRGEDGGDVVCLDCVECEK